MKEHKDQQQQQSAGSKTVQAADNGANEERQSQLPLKSLLKKPGQTKNKGSRNRVVINEKLNEFFAADYIILIKEECCPDYEEDCDCCCPEEQEIVNLGSCKECRAELGLGRLVDDCSAEGDEDDDDDDDEEEEDDDDDDEQMIDEDVLEDMDNDGRDHWHCRQGHIRHHGQNSHHLVHRSNRHQPKRRVKLMGVDGGGHEQIIEQAAYGQAQIHQKRETLSPPEGYKDLFMGRDTLDLAKEPMRNNETAVCAECDYYQKIQSDVNFANLYNDEDAEPSTARSFSSINNVDDQDSQEPMTSTSVHQSSWQNESQDDTETQTIVDQAQQAATDLQQRYLVETITMTTVTERRIVREINEPALPNSDEGCKDLKLAIESKTVENTETLSKNDAEFRSQICDNGSGFQNEDVQTDAPIPQYKLNSAIPLEPNNSKNSAVRQLFPDPVFVAPCAVPVESGGIDVDNSMANNDVDPGKNYIVATNSLRIYKGKNSINKINKDSRNDLLVSDNSIKRLIERNTLRRSLMDRNDTITRKNKKGLNKNLTLEERIKQLTCVDEDQDGQNQVASASATNNNNSLCHNDQLIKNSPDTGCSFRDNNHPHQHQSLIGRTSPSGEESPNDVVQRSNLSGHNSHHHHHHDNNHHSAYKKLTDLFSGKKNSHDHHNQRAANHANLPDIGLGNRNQNFVSKQNNKLNSEVRKQFLSSLTPLSCVASHSVDTHEDYYDMAPKLKNNSHKMNSVRPNSDSHSIQDVTTVHKSNSISCGPPDVTKGTPTLVGPSFDLSLVDVDNDELMAFVEQDKSRTERIRKRYEAEENGFSEGNNASFRKNDHNHNHEHSKKFEEGSAKRDQCDEDDDEHNDYGFNRRPSVRSIKTSFENTENIEEHLRNHAPCSTSVQENCRLVRNNQDMRNSDREVIYSNEVQRDDDTINRINSMQRQINDIYQSIAESSVAGVLAGTERGLSYLESTLPQKFLQDGQTAIRFGQHNGRVSSESLVSSRMLRLAGSKTGEEIMSIGSGTPTAVYSSFSSTQQYPMTQAIYSNYECDVTPPSSSNLIGGQAKCFRTMYLVPYTNLADPTYQNLQRMLPPHTGQTSNYSQLIERYPYPRNESVDQQPHNAYYVTPPNVQGSTRALHLHLHQAEQFQVSQSMTSSDQCQSKPLPRGGHPIQLQQVHHHQQVSSYNVQAVPAYSTPAPTPQSTATYTYQMQIQGRLASDLQTKTGMNQTSNILAAPVIANTVNVPLVSPTAISEQSKQLQKFQQTTTKSGTVQRSNSNLCSVSERGVPEGAASTPSHDFVVTQQTTVQTSTETSAPCVADNSNAVYYAMNV